MTFPKWRTVLFVNGCFWHQHLNCARSRLPKSNKEFWETKLKRNVVRDQRNCDLLVKEGWRVLVIWECEIACSNVTRALKVWF